MRWAGDRIGGKGSEDVDNNGVGEHSWKAHRETWES